METKTLTYLSIAQQDELRNRLKLVTENSGLRDKLFYSHGDKLSCLTLLTSGFLFWRCGFRAFHLDRYGKSRIQTLLASTIYGIPGGFMHAVIVKAQLTEYYRSENTLSYGIRSLVAHQLGLFPVWLASTATIFFIAQRNGMIPVPHDLRQSENRKAAYGYITSRLKPYRKLYAITFLGSSLIMFAIGMLEHKQSQQLLAKLNRRTLCMKEN